MAWDATAGFKCRRTKDTQASKLMLIGRAYTGSVQSDEGQIFY